MLHFGRAHLHAKDGDRCRLGLAGQHALGVGALTSPSTAASAVSAVLQERRRLGTSSLRPVGAPSTTTLVATSRSASPLCSAQAVQKPQVGDSFMIKKITLRALSFIGAS